MPIKLKALLSQIIKKILIYLLLLFSFLTTRAQQSGPPPTIKAGLEVDRSVLIKKVTDHDSTMVFKQQSDLDGLPDFIGIDKYKTSLQLIGKEDELTVAKWTFAFSTDKSTILKEIDNIGYFVFVMGEQQGVDWIREMLTKITNDHYKPISEIHSFNFDRQAQFKYDPQSRLLSLIFIQWGENFK